MIDSLSNNLMLARQVRFRFEIFSLIRRKGLCEADRLQTARKKKNWWSCQFSKTCQSHPKYDNILLGLVFLMNKVQEICLWVQKPWRCLTVKLTFNFNCTFIYWLRALILGASKRRPDRLSVISTDLVYAVISFDCRVDCNYSLVLKIQNEVCGFLAWNSTALWLKDSLYGTARYHTNIS